MTTSTNERTQFFKEYISLSLYSRKVDVSCVWEMSWRRGQTAILTKVLLTIATLLPHPCWVAQPWVTECSSPLSGAVSHSVGILSATDSNCPGDLVILFSDVHLLPLFFRLFTQVRLLIDGSVEVLYSHNHIHIHAEKNQQ